MAPRRLKTAVVGCGRIAYFLENDPLRYKPCTHIGAILSLQKKNWPAEISVLCDLDPAKPAEIAGNRVFARHNQPALCTDYRQALASQPDVLVIASSTHSHFDILAQALQAEIPRIVVEKPVVFSPAQAARLQRLARGRRSQVWVNYERRYHSKYLALKEMVRSQKPHGRALFYRGWFASPQKEFYPRQNHEGILLHDTTHLLDLVMFLFGPASRAPASALWRPRGNLHRLQLRHQKIEGLIETSRHSPFFHFELELVFEQARLRLGNGFWQVEKARPSPHYSSFISLSESEKVAEPAVRWESNPFVRLYQEVYGQAAAPVGMLEEACQNVSLLVKGGF